ncbi:MAG: ABC transporter permease [Fibrobacter sp.]|nr:ABC transporter permease [Fibrobacter sp.]
MLKQYPMLRYVLQKGFWYLLTFVFAVALNFALPRVGGSDPVDIIMGQAGKGLSPTEAQLKKAELLVSFGMAEVDEQGNLFDEQGNVVIRKVPKLDAEGKPVMNGDAPVMVNEVVTMNEPKRSSAISQFFSYIGNVFKGDLGKSYTNNTEVTTIIKNALPWTLLIQAPTILLGWIIGNLLGAFAAYKRGIFDKVFFPVAMFLNGVPYFVFGMLLVALFSITLGWFPAVGNMSPDIQEFSFSWTCLKSVGWYYILPFFSCFPILLSGQATGMRSMSIYELGTDYMKYAKWLGLREGRIISYVFRNAMLPQLTGLAQSLGAMVGGALITEMIFSYPGLGMAMLDAINKQDYATIQGCTLMISTCVLVANFAVDVLIAVFDPRVKAGLQMGGK